MTSRSATPGLAGSMIALCVLTLLAGCASRSLNTPQVVDWSDGARPAAPPTPIVPARAQTYTVKREDTLFSIAKTFNVSPADLAAWNNLAPNARLQINQVLRVNAPTTNSDSPTAVTQPIGIERIEQRPLASGGGSTAGSSNAPLKTGPLGVKRPYSDATLAELSRADGDAPPVPATTVEAPPPVSTAPSAPSLNWAWPAPGKVGATFADTKSKGIDIPGSVGDAVLAAADGKVTFAGAGVLGYGNFIIVRHTPELLSVYANNRANLVKEGAIVTRGQKIAEMGAAGSEPAKLHFEIRNDSKPVDPLKYLPAR
jgi:lipoprotein NlpD